jgi:hypothetical protein
LIDWLSAEDLLELDWDFPEDGDLNEAGMDEETVQRIIAALEDEYGVILENGEIAVGKKITPLDIVRMIRES